MARPLLRLETLLPKSIRPLSSPVTPTAPILSSFGDAFVNNLIRQMAPRPPPRPKFKLLSRKHNGIDMTQKTITPTCRKILTTPLFCSATPVYLVEPVHHFRFLDLPAETRNHIYGHTLTHNLAIGERATPAFLRVNKQIHKEACHLLITQSQITVDISVTKQGKTAISGDIKGNKRIFNKHTPLLRISDIWQDYLPRVPRVEVCATIEEVQNGDVPRLTQRLTAVSNTLYSLASLLGAGDILNSTVHGVHRSTRITILAPSLSSTNTTTAAENIFYPITKLPRQYTLILAGSLCPKVTTSLLTLHKTSHLSPTLSHSLLTIWQTLSPSALQLLSLTPSGTPRPTLHLFPPASPSSARAPLLAKLQKIGRAAFHVLKEVIEERAVGFDLKSERYYLGIAAFLILVLRALEEGKISVKELEGMWAWGGLAFEKMVGELGGL